MSKWFLVTLFLKSGNTSVYFYVFITEIYLTNIWHDNWRSVFDVVKGLRYSVKIFVKPSDEWVGPKKCWRNIWMVPKRPPDWPTDETARQRAKAHHEFPQVFHFICFHFTRNFFPHINSYNINIDNFHANELVATVIGISQRLWLRSFK